MHSRFRLHFLTTIAVGAFLLAGCLATAAKITPAERPTLGRIAVTSLLGPEFHLRLTGITVFQNKSAPQNVAEWRVDALLEATAIEALKKTGFSDARSLPLADLSAKDVRAAALLAAQKEGMNTLVTIGYIHTENQPFLNPGSYGIYSRGPNTCLFSKFFVTVWRVGDKSERKGSPQIDCTRIDGLAWKATFDEYSQEEKQKIQTALTSQLTAQITRALSETGLAEPAP
jgi:hypothetical protein